MFKFKKQNHSDDSKNWYKDKFESVRQQRDLLTAITLVSLLFSAGAVLTVMWLTPYKSVEPFVIQIDEKSGIVQRVDPVTRTEFTSNEAIDRYFAVQYIQAREGFIRSIHARNKEMVRVMSDRFTFRNYLQSINRSNPDSPLNLLEGEGERTVTVKSINFVTRSTQEMQSSKVALVRVLLTDKSRRLPEPIEYHNVITITFQYSNLNLNEQERYMNPLGFLVTNYEINREVVQ